MKMGIKRIWVLGAVVAAMGLAGCATNGNLINDESEQARVSWVKENKVTRQDLLAKYGEPQEKRMVDGGVKEGWMYMTRSLCMMNCKNFARITTFVFDKSGRFVEKVVEFKQ